MAAVDKARRNVAENRKARYNYFIDDTVEAGIMLTGTEVKSLRAGEANLNDAYADMRAGDIYLINAYIPEYLHGNRFNHDARRPRKLLLRQREINKLGAASDRKGYTLVPLAIYFNERGRAKVELGLGRGKAAHDKRDTIAKRDWERQKARLVKDLG